mmetsp:Transcript_2762/g.4170  ORF Transcript_2762/g.4170 Transcript_2762/m.4170 type:complete len:335 (-) Transcript_2762:122-1126(-)|eukprot:CAMPEP_0197247054 /NCGR_PEP_ID=MMETSP1429-20130617/26067_1 /TAXON_ID=49237 /ORGANISM="Chaetoceros  sp., Strain UNC1202" /LENGTH=334 /DNA_ID=CAMNT_0042707861 /DNA_START=98 /DNA_END=1102 /DNA_ORIENTATION=-
MSLSALNYPPLVLVSGMGLGAALPAIEKLVSASPWEVIRIANLLSYALNYISVSRPGRLDGQASEGGELAPISGRTLVAPAGWAFAIWAPIFLGELISVTAPFLMKQQGNEKIIGLLKQTSGPFIVAQAMQSLWCAAFRPKYEGAARFVSAGLLSATAYSLSRAHAIFTAPANRNTYSSLQYVIYFLPMALHFGWTTAASLVNLNGSISMMENTSSKMVALVGHASVVAASGLGVFLTMTRNAPVFGGVIAWALTACAESMKKRLASAEDEAEKKPFLNAKNRKAKGSPDVKKEIVGIEGAATQLFLTRAGAVVNALTVAFVTATGASKVAPVP